MKRVVSILFLTLMVAGGVQAQAPEMFNYQAVLRDASGNIMANQTVDIRLGIYDGSTMEYEETHNVTTDQYGLISLEAGNGTATSGTFSNLDWASTQYEMKVEVDDGSGYVSLGQRALSSVPYALNAGGSSAWTTSGGNVYYNSGNVGIGNNSPTGALHLTVGGVSHQDGFRMSDGSTNEDWYFYLPSSNGLTLRDDATDIVTFENNSGNVGIGTSSPSQRLHVAGSAEIDDHLYMVPNSSGGDTLFLGSFEFVTDGSNAFIFGISSTTGASLLPSADNTADLGNSSYRWDDVYASNGTIQTSDRRDKTSINDLDYGLEEVMNLRAVRFKWKEKENRGYKLGVIAQEVQGVLPEVVKTHDYKSTEEGGPVKKVKNERLGVYYSDMIPVLINAIQEQQKQIEDLKAQNKELKQLKSEVDALKQQIKNLK